MGIRVTPKPRVGGAVLSHPSELPCFLTPLSSHILSRKSQPPARRALSKRTAVTTRAAAKAGQGKSDAKPKPPAGESANGEPAKLQQTYTFHTPGSVQETDDVVVFAHQTDEEASKWENSHVSHVGDGNEFPVRVGVVIGEFHNRLMDRMLEDARVAAVSMNATLDEVLWVPGTYEAPLVVEKMLDSDLDAVVVLGYIEKGSTLHGQEMGATCSLVLKQLELEYSKPVGMGIIGPGATAEQAETRVAYAGNAMRAAIRMARFLAKPEVQ